MRANILVVLILICSFLLVRSSGPFNKTIGNFLVSTSERGNSLLSFSQISPANGPYILRLKQFFETFDDKEVEGSSIDLSGMSWRISDVSGVAPVKFNISLNNSTFGLTLMFTVFPNATNRLTCAGDFCVSFDILVSKYEWKNVASKLVILFDIFDGKDNVSESVPAGASSLRVTSSDAYFQVEPQFMYYFNETTKKEKENVTLSINKGILVSYVHFPSKYFLESSFSVGVTYTIKPPPPTVDTMSLIIGLCVSIAVVLVLCLAGCVYLRRGSKSGYTGV